MKSRMFGHILVAGALFAGAAMAADKTKPNLPRTDADITKSVQHELLSYPYYGIFDDLSFQVQNGQVSLLGEVTQPNQEIRRS